MTPEWADWGEKIPKAVFRGALSSFRRVPLFQLAGKHDDLLDIACTLLPAGAITADGRSWHSGGPALWAEEYHLSSTTTTASTTTTTRLGGVCGDHNYMKTADQQRYR